MIDRAGREGHQLGNYRLLHLLGRGGFADVYLGEHIYLETQAAIKVLHTQLESDDVEHFRHEARIIARLVHPHIVRVLEFGVEDGTPFLVVDYAPNGTLRKRYPKGVALPLSQVVTYTSQIADALQYAHDQRVVHRDVKPENMLVGRRNEVLLSDFGIAIVSQTSRYHNTQSMQDVAGTVAYMAPEQIQYQAVPASDQYSLAVVVYEWLTGERPFQGSFTEIAIKHSLATPPPLREKLPSLAPAVEEVIMKALAKEPKQRFPKIEEFALALEQAYRIDAQTRDIAQDTPSFVVPREGIVPTEEASPGSSATVALSEITTPATPQPVEAQPSITPKLAELPSLPETTGLASSPAEPERSAQRGLSRRAVVVGLTGAGVAAILGGALAYRQQAQHPTGIAPTATARPRNMGPALYAYQGHTGRVWSAVWSPDSTRVASASSDKTVQVWDRVDGGNLYTYSGHSDSVYAVAWSLDGKRIASASNDTTVQVWDATGGHPFTYDKHSSWVWSVVWSPDSQYIASAGGDKTVQLWKATSGQRILAYRGHTGNIYAVAWSPDGKYIASAGQDGTVQVWDALSGSLYYTYQPYSIQGYSTTIWSVGWSPDSQRIASAGNDNTVQVWDALNGAHLYIYRGHSDFVYTVTWSLNGKRIASAGDDKTVQVWDADDGDNAYIYRGHTDSVRGVAWSHHGDLIASASWDKTVQIWQAR